VELSSYVSQEVRLTAEGAPSDGAKQQRQGQGSRMLSVKSFFPFLLWSVPSLFVDSGRALLLVD
jgi:hypothetical protein